MKSLVKLSVALSAVVCSLSASAGEAEIRKGMQGFFNVPDAIAEINKLGYGDMYEVVLKNGDVLYAPGTGKYFFSGTLVDVAKQEDVTARREAARAHINFADLPLTQAIKQVRGNGKRVLATFEDPNCGYCKKLAKDLKDLKDVTIYTFMIPILAPDSEVKAKNIWCAADRAKAWNDWMIEGKEPAAAKCDDPISKNGELAAKLRVRGTPSLYFADGNRVASYIPAARLDEELNKAEANRTAKK